MSKETTANPVTGEIALPEGRGAIDVPSRKHEVLGILAFIGALVLLLAFCSYDGMIADGAPIPGGNMIGPFGMWVAHGAFAALGAAAYIVDVCLWVFGWMLFTGRSDGVRLRSVLGVLGIVLLSAIFLQAFMDGATVLGGHAAGGAIGLVLGALMIGAVSSAGTYIITIGGTILIVVLITDLSLYLVSRTCGVLALRGARAAGGVGVRVVKAWRETPLEEDARPPAPLIVVPGALEPDEAPPGEPVIVTKAKPKKKAKDKPAADEQLVVCRGAQEPSGTKFMIPPLSLLAPAEQAATRVDRAYLADMTDRLLRVLADFGVVGEVRAIHPGPVVTMFEFQPRSGTKLSKIESLSNEIAMALEMTRVRVVAPIPGKNAVGFELPNKERETVRLREILEDESYALNRKAKLPLALGKDITGAPYTVDLAKMPHLLMAGTTGSGKSVSVNTMLLSLLYRYTPDDLRLLLVDPKMIEFQPYNHIPHLLLPVVTDMSLACLALKWAVDEMERRYQLFADLGSVRNLEAYNAKVAKIREVAEGRKGTPLVEAETIVTESGEVVELGEIPRPEEKLPEKLPLVVICIDELADLMMVAAKDVETSIARLAQKARAAGIHLIVATQRPSTDVVTGLIKANFPARLSCQVSSGIDSRTILGTNGAESLLGNGDMLILPPGTSDLVRVQGAFVSDDEINAVVDFLKAQGLPTYDEDILKPREGESSAAVDAEEKDEIYDQAVQIVAETQACSISMIQRRLRIGYNRAARIVEIMEKEGVVGPANGVNKRDVLIGPQ